MQNQGLLLIGGIAALWLLRQRQGPGASAGPVGGGGGGGGDGPSGLSSFVTLASGEVVEPTGGEPLNGAGSGGVKIVSEANTKVDPAATGDEDIGVDPTGDNAALGYGGMTGSDPAVIVLGASTETVLAQDADAKWFPAAPVEVGMGVMINPATGAQSYSLKERDDDTLIPALISDSYIRVMDRVFTEDDTLYREEYAEIEPEGTGFSGGFVTTPSVYEAYLAQF
jgi:hypothetical protein